MVAVKTRCQENRGERKKGRKEESAEEQRQTVQWRFLGRMKLELISRPWDRAVRFSDWLTVGHLT